MSEKHTYPDGSARVGTPPFPKLSPMEEAAGKKEPEPTKEPAKKAAGKKEPEPVIEAQPEPVRKPGRPPKNQSTKEAAQ